MHLFISPYSFYPDPSPSTKFVFSVFQSRAQPCPVVVPLHDPLTRVLGSCSTACHRPSPDIGVFVVFLLLRTN